MVSLNGATLEEASAHLHRSRRVMLVAMADYQFSMVDEFEKFGRMEYRAFDSDAAAMQYAKELIGDWRQVTVLDGPRIVGMVVHPRFQIRG
jgi:hypothetical protein